jgi:hypothetical protein
MSKNLLPVVGLVFVTLFVFTFIGAGRGQEQRRAPVADASTVEAVRRGGLREAARLKGHYVASVNTSQWLKFDLESLTEKSAAIVIGKPTASASELNAEGDLINTEYRVTVEQPLKGDLSAGDVISVSVTGGVVVFEDGTSAEIQTPDFERMKTGKTYVLFLGRQNNAENVFVLTGGPQGLFSLPEDGSGIKLHGHKSDLVQKHKDQDAKDFLKEVKAAIKKHPAPGSCCS